MDDLQRALGDISSIRKQMARTTEFCGYGPATLATTGVIAVVAALLQRFLMSDPAHEISRYLLIWILTALVCAFFTGVQMYTRSRRIHSGLSQEMIRMAVEQFTPAGVSGILITFVLVKFAPSSLWILPGLWQIIFALGVFASCRFLPRHMIAAGAWYLFTGLLCVSLGDARALSPWAMGLPFGIGQAIVATVLYFGSQEAADES